MSKLNKEQIDKYNEDVIDALVVAFRDKNTGREFIKDLLSPKEHREISIRWQIIKKLVKGEKHRNISSDLKIGIGTVARGSRELSDKKGGFWKVVEIMKIKSK